MRVAGLLFVMALGLLVVTACGDDQPTITVTHPDLECDGERAGMFEADLDPDSRGAATMERVIRDVIVSWTRDFDGESVTLRSGVGGFVVDGRTVVIVEGREAPAGGYWADTVYFCQPFVVDDGAPITAPLVNASNTFVSCEPVPRFRLGDIEYENRRFDEVVALEDLGPVVGEIEVKPAGIDRCEVVVLQDGEGSWPAGTDIHEIVGVNRSDALTASLGNNIYLVFHGRPVAP